MALQNPFSNDLIARRTAELFARHLDQAGGQAARVQDSLAARGFGNNSPLAQLLSAQLESAGRAQGLSAQNEFELGAQQANADFGLAQRDLDLQRQQIANSLRLGLAQNSTQRYGIDTQAATDRARMNAQLQAQLLSQGPQYVQAQAPSAASSPGVIGGTNWNRTSNMGLGLNIPPAMFNKAAINRRLYH